MSQTGVNIAYCVNDVDCPNDIDDINIWNVHTDTVDSSAPQTTVPCSGIDEHIINENKSLMSPDDTELHREHSVPSTFN